LPPANPVPDRIIAGRGGGGRPDKPCLPHLVEDDEVGIDPLKDVVRTYVSLIVGRANSRNSPEPAAFRPPTPSQPVPKVVDIAAKKRHGLHRHASEAARRTLAEPAISFFLSSVVIAPPYGRAHGISKIDIRRDRRRGDLQPAVCRANGGEMSKGLPP